MSSLVSPHITFHKDELGLSVIVIDGSLYQSFLSDLSRQIVCQPTEVEMMKERFAKLLLGEDMSGGGKGVCTALAISNAITNLSGMKQSFLQSCCE